MCWWCGWHSASSVLINYSFYLRLTHHEKPESLGCFAPAYCSSVKISHVGLPFLMALNGFNFLTLGFSAVISMMIKLSLSRSWCLNPALFLLLTGKNGCKWIDQEVLLEKQPQAGGLWPRRISILGSLMLLRHMISTCLRMGHKELSSKLCRRSCTCLNCVRASGTELSLLHFLF